MYNGINTSFFINITFKFHIHEITRRIQTLSRRLRPLKQANRVLRVAQVVKALILLAVMLAFLPFCAVKC